MFSPFCEGLLFFVAAGYVGSMVLLTRHRYTREKEKERDGTASVFVFLPFARAPRTKEWLMMTHAPRERDDTVSVSVYFAPYES